MQNPISKLRQSSIISVKPDYLFENFKIDELQLPDWNIFCPVLPPVSYKRISEIF